MKTADPSIGDLFSPVIRDLVIVEPYLDLRSFRGSQNRFITELRSHPLPNRAGSLFIFNRITDNRITGASLLSLNQFNIDISYLSWGLGEILLYLQAVVGPNMSTVV